MGFRSWAAMGVGTQRKGLGCSGSRCNHSEAGGKMRRLRVSDFAGSGFGGPHGVLRTGHLDNRKT